MKKFAFMTVAAALLVTGCSAKSHYIQTQEVRSRYLITMGDTNRPYQSLGYVQLTRKGADILGFVSVVDADIQKLFGDELVKELQMRRADGIINVRFKERQYTTLERILIMPFIIIPLPTKVELSGELIRWSGPGRTASL